ncbi:cation efflux family protein family [Ophiostoma piceae UAMH 11346]|uniref:Zinc transporter n=1 Tax=Ophiostoma piceae (strain UAMH 11346) TaxID=1262450 RepID=S3C7G9_OPHP1|nr:cation efflux family protein family [Ophiostoma piceae UAMH 11346]
MASGPAPPSISVSSTGTTGTTGNSPTRPLPPQQPLASSPAPPSILLEPTSDNDGDHGNDDDDPFSFEVEDTDFDDQTEKTTTAEHTADDDAADNDDSLLPRNPHAEALLRRSPSPGLDSSLPHSHSHSRSPSPSHAHALAHSLGNSSPQPRTPAAHSKAYAQNRLSAGFSPSYLSPNSFLRPPSGSFGAMDDLSSSPAGSAPIAIQGQNDQTGQNGDGDSNPFNFQTEYISTSPVKSNIGLRRGHRYKHSSVSAQHQIFQEPPPRPPPVLPASLPIPTVREAWGSMHRDQRARFYWCMCHAAVATLVFWCASDGGDSLALTALSHLVFFDVGSAAVCVAVDVLGNFEVWRRSTIRHPFGLRRAEVLAGFAMSIFLVFGGFDLLSHDLKDCLEAAAESGSNAPHIGHAHPVPDGTLGATTLTSPHLDIGSHSGHHHARYIAPGTVDFPALAAFLSTLVSAYGLGNHARIRRSLLLLHGVAPFSQRIGVKSGRGAGGIVSMFLGAMSWMTSVLSSIGLSSVLANPFHFLTMAVSLVLLVLPLMFVAVQTWLDRLLCATIALSMLLLGARLAVAQGLMLLMSYNGKDGGQTTEGTSAVKGSIPVPDSKNMSTVSSVLDEIASEPQVARVEDAQFWQVHYGLCMANLNVRVAQGYDDDSSLRQLRTRIARVVQNRLGEGYGRGNSLRWEVTVQTSLDG